MSLAPPQTALERLTEAAILIDGSQDASDRAAVLSGLLLNHAPELAKLYRTDAAAFEGILIRMRGIRGMTGLLKTWLRPIKELAKAQTAEMAIAAATAGQGELGSLDALTEALKGAPAMLAPPGYRVDLSGIWRGDEQIAHDPIVVTGVTRDLESGDVRWEMAWRWRGRWERRSVERHRALDARSLQKLSAYGVPAGSDNAAALVGYLRAFENANLPLIPQRATTSRMGWIGPRVFQLGDHCIGSDAILVADGGLEDLAKGVRLGGEWPAYQNTIRRHVAMKHRHSVLLAIYASASAPFLHVLEADGFVMDWSGVTSRGKTSALRVAASVWGHPDTLVGSWATASAVGPQTKAAFLHHLPVILDDTQRVKDRPEIVAGMLYDIPAGSERVRGNADGGLRKTKTWRTIMLSTGEKAAIDFSQDAGARARCLCLRGAPFGSDTDANRLSTEALQASLRRNYGHLGRRVLEYLVLEMSHADLRARWNEVRDAYGERAKGSVSRRLAASVAVLHVTAEICHKLGLPGAEEMEKALEMAWAAAQVSGADSDRPAAAFRTLLNWCTANASRFEGATSSKKEESPHQGWAGKWRRILGGAKGSGYTWKQLAIYPEVVRTVLARAGYDVIYVTNEWERRGFLEPSGGKKPQALRRIRVCGSLAWLWVFTPDSVGDFLEED